MIAYNKDSLANLEVIERAKEWVDKKIISEEQYKIIKENHAHKLFIPNIFVRIGLFVLTLILVNAALGLFSMFFIVIEPTENAIAGIAIFYGIVVLVALEVVIDSKKTYKAGIDDGLLYLSVSAMVSGLIFLLYDFAESTGNELFFLSLMALPFFVAGAVRYLDNLMVICAFVCINLMLFSLAVQLGSFGKAATPFLVMSLSAAIYYLSHKYKYRTELRFWIINLNVLQFLSLIAFYFAGNYFVVRELTLLMFNLSLEPGNDIPLGFIFHITTVIIPLLYLYFGGKRKDRIIFLSGLFAIVLSALTFKYYYSLGNHGISLTFSGIFLTAVVWYFIKYYSATKFGITSEKEDELISSDAEGLILTFSFPQQPIPSSPTGTEFGGGDFGGGGAGGNF